MQLSSLMIGDIARILPDGEEFLVTRRDPEDRSSGVTHIRYLSGRGDVFVWDVSNPDVAVTGRGRIEERFFRE